jgi:hypothetical protein
VFFPCYSRGMSSAINAFKMFNLVLAINFCSGFPKSELCDTTAPDPRHEDNSFGRYFPRLDPFFFGLFSAKLVIYVPRAVFIS